MEVDADSANVDNDRHKSRRQTGRPAASIAVKVKSQCQKQKRSGTWQYFIITITILYAATNALHLCELVLRLHERRRGSGKMISRGGQVQEPMNCYYYCIYKTSNSPWLRRMRIQRLLHLQQCGLKFVPEGPSRILCLLVFGEIPRFHNACPPSQPSLRLLAPMFCIVPEYILLQLGRQRPIRPPVLLLPVPLHRRIFRPRELQQ